MISNNYYKDMLTLKSIHNTQLKMWEEYTAEQKAVERTRKWNNIILQSEFEIINGHATYSSKLTRMLSELKSMKGFHSSRLDLKKSGSS